MKKQVLNTLTIVTFSCFLMSCVSEHKIPSPSTNRYTKDIVVAVIDTGIDNALLTSGAMCPRGHKDFTGYGLQDIVGHGTHISGLIHQYATSMIIEKNLQYQKIPVLRSKRIGYCQVILKFYHNNDDLFNDNSLNAVKAIRYAIKLKVDVINLSLGGTTFSKEEKDAIEDALKAGIKIVAAAGNENSNIDKKPYFPAVLDTRIIVVGNLLRKGIRNSSSNYGKSVKYWEYGSDRISWGMNYSLAKMSGTSQATAVKTGKIIHEMLKNKRSRVFIR